MFAFLTMTKYPTYGCRKGIMKRENRKPLSRYKVILIETNNVNGAPSQQRHRTKVKVTQRTEALAPTGSWASFFRAGTKYTENIIEHN